MVARVTVAERIFEKQGYKLVRTSDGRVQEVLAGKWLEEAEEVLVRAGEPAFQVRLATAVRNDEDLPDELGFALRRVGQRLYRVMPDGQEAPEGQGPVEWVLGPTIADGVVVLELDTDGDGFSRPMIDTMVAIFVEELAPLGVQAEIAAAPAFTGGMRPAWMSSDERQEE